MKKRTILVLCLVLAIVAAGCGRQSKNNQIQEKVDDKSCESVEICTPSEEQLQNAGAWKVSAVDDGSEAVFLSAEDSKKIKDYIASCKYELGTADCLNDYMFIRADGSIIYYHSECGTFNDTENELSYKLLGEQQAWINNLLIKSIT